MSPVGGLRVHHLQHVPFEGLGSIGPWLAARGARVGGTRLFEEALLPATGDFDWLVVLGGPMSANDEQEHAWLVPETRLIAEAVEAGKVVLGICLGAQLVAKALGARVYPNRDPEIGWFPVGPAPGASTSPLAAPLVRPREVFHWHGETFDLPDGALRLARSDACENQAFAVGDRVLGLQFHLEMTPEGARALVEHCGDELAGGGRWIQSGSEMLRDPDRFAAINQAMAEVLERLARA